MAPLTLNDWQCGNVQGPRGSEKRRHGWRGLERAGKQMARTEREGGWAPQHQWANGVARRPTTVVQPARSSKTNHGRDGRGDRADEAAPYVRVWKDAAPTSGRRAHSRNRAGEAGSARHAAAPGIASTPRRCAVDHARRAPLAHGVGRPRPLFCLCSGVYRERTRRGRWRERGAEERLGELRGVRREPVEAG